MKALVVAAGIVFWTLVLGIAWLAFFPGSDAGEPVAILQIEPGPAGDGGAGAEDSAETPDQGAASVPSEQPAETAPAAAPAASGDNVNMPPGFAVAPGANPQAPMVQPPGPGQMMPPEATPAPDAGAPGGRQGAADTGEQTASTAPSAQDAAPQASGNQQTAAVAPPPPLDTPAVEPGGGPLPAVPVAELVEDSQYGPLPKVASDGRRAIDVYARPSRYAAKSAPGDPARIA